MQSSPFAKNSIDFCFLIDFIEKPIAVFRIFVTLAQFPTNNEWQGVEKGDALFRSKWRERKWN
jgi:hypothetical protein